MTVWQGLLLAAGIAAIDLMVLGAVAAMCAAAVAPLARAYPPVEPSREAVVRRFQSFKFDLLSYGGCVHVAADEAHLHLRPARIARWFGLRPMSIPWAAVTLERVKGKGAVARIGKTVVRGPAWCLSLAGPVEPAGSAR